MERRLGECRGGLLLDASDDVNAIIGILLGEWNVIVFLCAVIILQIGFFIMAATISSSFMPSYSLTGRYRRYKGRSDPTV